MLIAGNWKMHKGPAETRAFCHALRAAPLPDAVDVVVCPPYVSLGEAVQALAGTEIGVFAQNCHWEHDGAFTGEVAAPMLRELGVYGTIVGHSERRQLFCESDATVARRASAALEAGLHVIACVGESEDERERGETEAVLRRQVGALEHDDNLVVAYEPVWAIGTGLTPSAEEVQDAVAFVRALVEGFDKAAGQAVRVLYGGSLKPDNCGDILCLPDVDGALVGGASLEPESFAHIVHEAGPSEAVTRAEPEAE
jgi:triosephosphate isomerase (TIM)